MGDVVSWTIDSLAANGGVTHTSFVVTASQTITNSHYGVRADMGHRAIGQATLTTIISSSEFGTAEILLPVILKE